MIVQCDQCNAKFRLEDTKVKDGGAKVRCSKCKHIFVVQREMANDEADFDSLLKGLVPPNPEAPKEPFEAASPNAGQFAAEAGESSGIGITATEERTVPEVSNDKAEISSTSATRRKALIAGDHDPIIDSVIVCLLVSHWTM